MMKQLQDNNFGNRKEVNYFLGKYDLLKLIPN